MTAKFIKSTSRGQVTLPKEWRDQFKTDNFIVKMKKDRLIIVPIEVDLEDEKEEDMDLDEFLEHGETVVWDAKRDNKGKGVDPQYFIDLIEKINKEEDE